MLTLHFDYPSPAAAVAVVRLQRVADAGAAVTFSGLDVLGLAVPVPPPLDLLAELDRWRPEAAAVGLTLRKPSRRPPTAAAHVVGRVADGAGVGAAWRWACLQAYWHDDADLCAPDVLVGLARDVGIDPVQAAAAAADPDALRAQRYHAAAQRHRGIGGVPVLEVAGTFVAADLPVERLHELAAL